MLKKILLLITGIILMISIVSATNYIYDYTNFSNSNVFGQHYNNSISDYTGFNSEGGVAYYDLSLNPSGTLYDQWGSSDGTRNNGQSGPSFDGTDDYIDLGNVPVTNNEMTVCFIANLSYSGFTETTILSKLKTVDNQREWRIYTDDISEELYWRNSYDGTSSGYGDNIITTGDALEYGKENNWCVSYNNGYVTIYKNGNNITSGDTGTTEIFKGNANFEIGRYDSDTRYVEGNIYNVSTFDYALNSTQVLEIYELNKPETRSSYILTDGLVAGYDFALNQNSEDISGNGNDLTIEGTEYSYIGTGINKDETTYLIADNLGFNETPSQSISYFATINPELSQAEKSIGIITRLFGSNAGGRSGSLSYTNYIDTQYLRCNIYNDINEYVDYKISLENLKNKQVGCIIDWENSNLSIYVNGILVNSSTITLTESLIGISSWEVGGHVGSSGWDDFNGTIKNVFIYDKVLSDEEVLALNNSGSFVEDKLGESNNAFNSDGSNYIGFNTGTINNYKRKIVEDYMSISFWAKRNNNETTEELPIQFCTSFSCNNYFQFLNENASRIKLYGDNGAIQLSINNTVNTEEWVNYVFVYDDNVFVLYENGVLNNQSNVSGTFGELGNVSLYKIGRVNGSIDEVRIYDRALSELDVKNLYGTYNKYNQNISSINLNNETNNELNFNISYSNYTEASTCGAISNDTSFVCSNKTVTGTSGLSQINCSISGEASKEVEIKPFCEDSTGIIYSSINNILLDNVNPTMTIYSPNPNNTSIYFNVTNVLINVSFADSNLYGYNITCYNADNTQAYTTQHTGITTDTYNFSSYNRFIGTPSLKTCEFTVADSHTAEEINFNVKIKRSFLGFGEDKIEINNGEVEIVYPKENKNKIINVNFEKKKDRISPEFTTEIDDTQEYTELDYIVRFNGKVDSIKSKYLGHIVVLPDNNLKSGYWHDLENEVDAEIISEQETILENSKEIKYKLRIPNSKYKGELKTNSIGGLNIVSQNLTFTTVAGQNITINNTNEWTGLPVKTNITLLNSSGTFNYNNVENQYIETGCGTNNLLSVVSNNYTNSYSYPSSGCSFASNYSLTFYQGTILADVRNGITNSLIPNSYLTVTDGSITKNYLTTDGEQTIKVNKDTYTLNSSKSGYISSNSNTSTISSLGDIKSSNVYMDKNITLKITVLDAETETWNASLDATIDIYNSVADYNYSETFASGESSIIPVKEGSNRLNVYADGYNSNLLYYDFTLSQQYNITVYLSNSTSTGIKDLILQSRDESDQIKPGVEIRVYKQTGNIFNLVSSPTTNINGEALIQVIEETEFYKFIGYFNNVKCYESSEYQIKANDEIFVIRCILGTDYISKLDDQNNIISTFYSDKLTNDTGIFYLETISGTLGEVCLNIYDTSYLKNELYASNCTNETSSIIQINVNTTKFPYSYKGVFTFQPIEEEYPIIKDTKYLNFEDTRADWGNWGFLFLLISLPFILISLLKYPPIGILVTSIFMSASVYLNFIPVDDELKNYVIIGFITIGVIIAWILESRNK